MQWLNPQISIRPFHSVGAKQARDDLFTIDAGTRDYFALRTMHDTQAVFTVGKVDSVSPLRVHSR